MSALLEDVVAEVHKHEPPALESKVFQLNPKASRSQLEDEITRILQMASSQTIVMRSDGDDFNNWSDDIRHSYIEALRLNIENAKSLFGHYSNMVR
ncbi:MAG: hypothetical protein OEZ68_21620 [Gammaproteobacteria bacterium]|nr:hypothetical protein [Gammaproteobacteria bacterium]MDH5803399.1 hypothetical protein [Gammaproteobacteria bacterium]